MTRATATVFSEDIEVIFSGSQVKVDNGSPDPYYSSWYEVEDIDIEELTILGVKIEKPQELPKELLEAIFELAYELSYYDWE